MITDDFFTGYECEASEDAVTAFFEAEAFLGARDFESRAFAEIARADNSFAKRLRLLELEEGIM